MNLMWIIAIVVFVLIYVISPIDILPDVIPITGWLDDTLLLGLLIYYLKYRRLPRFMSILKNLLFGPQSNPHRQQSNREYSATEDDPEYRQTQKDPYVVLGVRPGASEKEIHAAYRKAAQKYHPDKVNHLGEDFQQLAKKRFVEIQEAYEELIGSGKN